jgi:hypothetical protein
MFLRFAYLLWYWQFDIFLDLLQMFYIDNLDLGPLSKAHTIFPRIVHFESETQINKMIMEDMRQKGPGQCDPSWGASKVGHSPYVSCFHAIPML